MFKTVFFAIAAALVGSVTALPTPDREVRFAVRDVQVIGVRSIPVQAPELIVRGEYMIPVEKRQIPEEVPVRATNGQITAIKRQTAEEDPVTTDNNGNVIPYVKREPQGNIPAEIAVTTDGSGNIIPYGKVKREAEPQKFIPLELAVRTDEFGNIVPY